MLSKNQKKMLRELDDMVEYYGADTRRRAIVKTDYGITGCVYKSPRGKMCAVGRKLNQKDLKHLEDSEQLTEPICEVIDKLTTKIILDLPLEFWEELQNLHDDDENWGKRKGLSVKGIEGYELIKKKILNKDY